MIALSIRQPWAWLILFAGKDIENRDWPTNRRGRIQIHASKGMTRDEYLNGIHTLGEIKLAGKAPQGISLPMPEALERGGIVGSVEIYGCVQRSSSPWFFGEYGFQLRDPKPLPFAAYKGRLGFFDVPEIALASVPAAAEQAALI